MKRSIYLCLSIIFGLVFIGSFILLVEVTEGRMKRSKVEEEGVVSLGLTQSDGRTGSIDLINRFQSPSILKRTTRQYGMEAITSNDCICI